MHGLLSLFVVLLAVVAGCPTLNGKHSALSVLPSATSLYCVAQGLFYGIFRGAQFFWVLPSPLFPLGVGALGEGPLESS